MPIIAFIPAVPRSTKEIKGLDWLLVAALLASSDPSEAVAVACVVEGGAVFLMMTCRTTSDVMRASSRDRTMPLPDDAVVDVDVEGCDGTSMDRAALLDGRSVDVSAGTAVGSVDNTSLRSMITPYVVGSA